MTGIRHSDFDALMATKILILYLEMHFASTIAP